MHIQALVIKKTPRGEHDQLVGLYSLELGKTLAVAKSASKAHSVQALALDQGNLIECELVEGRGAPIITGARAVRCWSGAKGSLMRWAACQFFLQVLDTIVYDNEPDGELWESVREALVSFDACADQEVLALFRERQDHLLHVLGYGRLAQAADLATSRGRTQLDDTYERIAQRHLATLDVLYDLAR